MFYEDVRVPGGNLVGGENDGWTLITNQLNHERVTLCSRAASSSARSPRSREWAQETKLADGRRVIDQEWVQLNLARVHAKLEFLRLMNWQVAWEATQGVLDIGHCSSIKVFGTEFYLEAFRLLMEVLGAGRVPRSPTRPARCCESRIEAGHRGTLILTFGGGTNEMQRDLISQFALGFPRASR